MAKGPKQRDPAKHSKKDPAKPTRAKAARPDVPHLDPSLAELLNPAIGQGRAGVGSQTGIEPQQAKTPASPQVSPPPPERWSDKPAAPQKTGLQPPPDNSRDRRADFANAHRARKSTQEGFGEAPQQSYVGKDPSASPISLGELDPDLARALGIGDDTEQDGASPPSQDKGELGGVITPDMPPKRARIARADIGTVAGLASQQSLDRLLREGRAEFRETLWTPHRPPRPDKSEGGKRFVIKSDFDPKGDQPTAIADLVEGVGRNDRTQVLLGVTGSGKTFTMAKVIEATQRPALILAPNKTLAAQLYGEFRNFFPDNAVEYFVSYYDYYQPEAYIPRTDTYIEKDSSINEQIDRMRHSATRALLERDDVIIVASVSCIYGIGSVETYSAM